MCIFNTKTWLQKLSTIVLVFCLGFAVLSPSVLGLTENVVMADDGTPNKTDSSTNTNSTPPTEVQRKFSEIASSVNSIFTPMVALATTIVGETLGNKWIYGTGGQHNNAMESVLHEMWKIVRDLVNYVFILILVGLAFMNVLTAGSEMHSKFDVKTTLPKIVLALVAVNFTWFGAKVAIDAANVATHIVFAIPRTAAEMAGTVDYDISKTNFKCVVDKIIVLDKDSIEVGSTKTSSSECKTYIKDRLKIVYTEANQNNVFEKMDGHVLTSLFAYGILHIENLPLAPDSSTSKISLGVNSLVAFVLMSIILVVLGAMAVVLIIRILVLWINIVLSPIFVLLPIIGAESVPVGDEKTFGWKAFLKQAFLPAMMALPLVIGLTMIIAGQSLGADNMQSDKIIFEGKLINGVNNLQQAMWYVLAIIVMWGSVKIAQESSEFAGAIIEPVAGAIKGGAKWLAKTPIYTPWIPVKSKKSDGSKQDMAIGDLLPAFKSFGRQRELDSRKRLEAVGVSTGASMGLPKEIKDIIDKLDPSKYQTFANKARANNWSPDDIKRNFGAEFGAQGRDILTKAKGQDVGIEQLFSAMDEKHFGDAGTAKSMGVASLIQNNNVNKKDTNNATSTSVKMQPATIPIEGKAKNINLQNINNIQDSEIEQLATIAGDDKANVLVNFLNHEVFKGNITAKKNAYEKIMSHSKFSDVEDIKDKIGF